jgi:CHAT domain-containing protein
MVPLFREGQLSSLLSVKTDRRSDYVNDLYAYADRGLVIKAEKQASLEQLIREPLMKYIENENTLFIAPGGVLHRINLGAIPTSPERVLADDFRMVFLGSTRHLVTDPNNFTNEPPAEAMIFGGIRFDPDSTTLARSTDKPVSAVEGSKRTELDSARGNTWSYLSWTAKEANTIAGIMSDQGITTQSYLEDKASEEAFKEMATISHGNRILHLATHGFFYPDPTSSTTDNRDVAPAFKESDDPMIRSGLVLANGNYAWQYGRPLGSGMEDGILTALEISQLDLSNVELVVLSACETGLGDIQGNEGVYGLQRAFKIAGAKYLIMSLWQVPDRETMQFMTTFYRNWLEEKMTIPEAFRKTQLEMRDRFFNPYAWAGFVLVE